MDSYCYSQRLWVRPPPGARFRQQRKEVCALGKTCKKVEITDFQVLIIACSRLLLALHGLRIAFLCPVPSLAMNSNEAFYVHVHGEQKGPYTIRHLDHLLNSGLIPLETMYWTDGLDQWIPVTELVPMRPKPRIWLRLGIAAGIVAVVGAFAGFFGPTIMDGWRENTQRDYSTEAAYWSARNAVRAKAVPAGNAVHFAPVTEAMVTLNNTNTANVILKGEVLGPDAKPIPSAWKVDLSFNSLRREWTGSEPKPVVE